MCEKVLISIVIAVYNTEKYLERCLKTILSQENCSIEVVLVDDGSTDRSPEICDQYAVIDNRVKVIHKKNGGQASVRNTGITVTSGKYLWFIDSDDWIAEDSLKILEKIINKYCPDVLLFDYKICTEYKKIFLGECKNSVYVIEEKKVIDELLSTKIQSYAWDRVVKKDIYINNSVTFPEGRVYEDTATMYKTLVNADLVMKIDAEIYQYFQRDGSVTKVFTEKSLSDLYMAVEELFCGIQRYCENEEYLKKKLQMFSLNCFLQIYVFAKRTLKINPSKKIKELSYIIIGRIKENDIGLKNRRMFRGYAMYKYYLLYKFGVLDIFLNILSIIRRS